MRELKKKSKFPSSDRTHTTLWNIAPDMLKKHAFPVYIFQCSSKPTKKTTKTQSTINRKIILTKKFPKYLLRILTHSHSQENFSFNKKKSLKGKRCEQSKKTNLFWKTHQWIYWAERYIYIQCVNEMESWTAVQMDIQTWQTKHDEKFVLWNNLKWKLVSKSCSN